MYFAPVDIVAQAVNCCAMRWRRTARLCAGRREWLRVAAAWGAALLGAPSWAQPKAAAPAVKAAYLYKFLSYVEWPPVVLPEMSTPLVIGVAGADDVHAELEALVTGRQVNGRSVIVRQLGDSDSLDGLHAVFVGRGPVQAGLLAELRGRPVLVVMDGGVAMNGAGMLRFLPVDGRLRFEAAPAVAERAGLRLGSRLLAVAERIVAP